MELRVGSGRVVHLPPLILITVSEYAGPSYAKDSLALKLDVAGAIGFGLTLFFARGSPAFVAFGSPVRTSRVASGLTGPMPSSCTRTGTALPVTFTSLRITSPPRLSRTHDAASEAPSPFAGAGAPA